jgi:hypothetical protein
MVLPWISSFLISKYFSKTYKPPKEVAIFLHLLPHIDKGLPVNAPGDHFQTNFEYSSTIQAII